MASEPVKIDLDGWREKDIESVLRGICFKAGRDLDDVLALMNETFGEQEASGQLLIVAGRAHGDSDAAPTNAYFQRFFWGHRIGLAGGFFTYTAALDLPEDGRSGGRPVVWRVSLF